jgi:hypothetical protein
MDDVEVHNHHPHPVGHRVFDFVVSGCALLVSCISLFIAVRHGETMEKLVQSNSFPSVELAGTIGSTDTPGEIALSADLTNNGVGPARIESIEFWENGEPVRSAEDFVKAIKSAAGDVHGKADFSGATVVGSLIGAGKTKKLVQFKFSDQARWYPILAKLGFGLESRVCYCSVFDECYVSDTRANHGRPIAVNRCPAPPAPYDDDFSKLVLAKPGLSPSATVDFSAEHPKP